MKPSRVVSRRETVVTQGCPQPAPLHCPTTLIVELTRRVSCFVVERLRLSGVLPVVLERMNSAVAKEVTVHPFLVDDYPKHIALSRLEREVDLALEGFHEERREPGGQPNCEQPVADRGFHRRRPRDGRPLDLNPDLLGPKQAVFTTSDFDELRCRGVVFETLEVGVLVALHDELVFWPAAPEIDDVLQGLFDGVALVRFESGVQKRSAKTRHTTKWSLVPGVWPRARIRQRFLFAELYGDPAICFDWGQPFWDAEVGGELGVLSAEGVFNPGPSLGG